MKIKNQLTPNIVLLLTACVNPGNVPYVARRDPDKRLNDYINSLKYWLHLPSIMNIVFCENSGFDLSDIQEAIRINNPYHKKVEALSFYGQPVHPEYGKGYGEMKIINYALEHSNIIKESNIVLKVTGRLIVANAAAISEAVSKTNGIDVFCDLRGNLTTADSRFFCATPRFLREYFMSFQESVDESTGISFEDALARAVHLAMADGLSWSMLPHAHDLRGISGTSNRRIPSSRLRFMSRELFRIVKAWVISRDKKR